MYESIFTLLNKVETSDTVSMVSSQRLYLGDISHTTTCSVSGQQNVIRDLTINNVGNEIEDINESICQSISTVDFQISNIKSNENTQYTPNFINQLSSISQFDYDINSIQPGFDFDDLLSLIFVFPPSTCFC